MFTKFISMKIILPPSGNQLYRSFYIEALRSYCDGNLEYSFAPFKELPRTLLNGSDLLFVVLSHGVYKRFYVSLYDSYNINEVMYQWCDVYGGVNVNYALTDPKYHAKLVSLCPSFGIKYTLSCKIYWDCISNCLLSGIFHIAEMRKFVGKYKRTNLRPKLDEYYQIIPKRSKPYIFFCSTLWYDNEWNKNDENVNLSRANFIRACKTIPHLDFEGGLVSQGKTRSSEDKFYDCLYRGVPMKDWITKTKQSDIVFNTPAFWNCHGWKLGEYLALGKCIISTSLSNDLPAPLQHGIHIHFVENNVNAMKEAIEYILAHPDYQHQLEQGASDYWKLYGTPNSALNLLGL